MGFLMTKVLTGISGNLISAASAGFAPTNSADVSAIASAYQVVSATATQLYAGTAYVTSVNEAPVSAERAGNAANASLATSAYYDGTGRLISSLPDSATVSAIASSYAESAASSKQDTLTFGYDTSDKISSINGSSLAGEGGGGIITSIESSLDPWYRTAISGLNGSSIYPKWAESALSAGSAATAEYASCAGSAAAAPTGWASSFISSVSSPSGTIRVLNGNEIEGTNSAVLPSTVVEGFSVVSSSPYSLTAFSFTVPTSNPNTQVVITGGWVNGNFGISGDNGVTAESSLAGPLDVTFDMPGATAFDVTSDAWIGGLGYTASALASEVGGGIGELAWASALPTYQYDAEDKISSINGSAIAGGGAAGVDSATCSAIASAYAESAVSSVSGNYYTTANESGYALSSDVSATVDLVGTQSANWGGSALALSAGPGVKFDKVGNTLVASTDDTVLWSGSQTLGAAVNITSLSESVEHFQYLDLYYKGYTTHKEQAASRIVVAGSGEVATLFNPYVGGSNTLRLNFCGVSWSGTTLSIESPAQVYIKAGATVSGTTNNATLTRIVGINRTAEV